MNNIEQGFKVERENKHACPGCGNFIHIQAKGQCNCCGITLGGIMSVKDPDISWVFIGGRWQTQSEATAGVERTINGEGGGKLGEQMKSALDRQREKHAGDDAKRCEQIRSSTRESDLA